MQLVEKVVLLACCMSGFEQSILFPLLLPLCDRGYVMFDTRGGGCISLLSEIVDKAVAFLVSNPLLRPKQSILILTAIPQQHLCLLKETYYVDPLRLRHVWEN